MRWTTGIGIAVGGVGGAIAALMGAPQASVTVSTPSAAIRAPSVTAPAASVPAFEPSIAATPAVASAASSASPSASPLASPSASASASASASSVAPNAPAATLPAIGVAPALELPTTRDGLLKAEMFCDQKKAFDECERAAESLEKGSTGPVDLEQAKRFRRIALTHLVAQCEADSAHACFVLAAKYRAGTELTASPTSAEALEKRGLELCRLHTAAECPTGP